MHKTARALVLSSALLALAACDEFQDPKKQSQYDTGNPVEVTRVFDCPVYAQKIAFKGESRNIFVTHCPQVKSINWTQQSGKTRVPMQWVNASEEP